MTTTVCTLGGVPLSANRPVVWALTSGIAPYEAVFELTRARADQILARGGEQLVPQGVTRARQAALGPLELVVAIPDRDPITVKGLYVVGETAGSTPWTKGVRVADGRWLLRYQSVHRAYNLTKRSGRKRLLGKNTGVIEPEAVIPRVDDMDFYPYSLDGRVRWSAARAVLDFVEHLDGLSVTVDPISLQLPIQDMRCTGFADAALARLLSYLPGYDLRPNYDGTFTIYNTRDQSERQYLELPPREGSGTAMLVDRSLSRPSGYDIRVMREVEIRFNYAEDNQNATRVRGREPRELENVAANPDFTSTVNGVTYHQGTWVKIGDASSASGGTGTAHGLLGAWEATKGADGKSLTQAALRTHYMNGNAILTGLYGVDSNGYLNLVNMARLAEIQRRWRRTFRIAPFWKDKILSWRPYRVAVIDTETGARAPSPVFVDFVVRPSVRALAVKRASQNSAKGYEATGYAALIESGRSAPFLVVEEDQDQGVFTIEPRLDPFGNSMDIAIGSLVDEPPTSNLDLLQGPGGTLARHAVWNQLKLAASFQMSVILSCVQAVPNNLDAMHSVRFSTSDAAAAMGQADPGGRGPMKTIILGPQLIMARVGWRDSIGGQIEEAFYTGGEMKDDWVVNYTAVYDVAKAAAARDMANHLDRVEGNFVVSPQQIVPTGSLRNVTHILLPSGEAGTHLEFPPLVEIADPTAFIPESLLALTHRLVQ